MSNIYSALSEIMKRIDAIGKDQKNTLQNYKFRGIDDVYNELHKHFAECGVFNIPRVINRIEEKYESNKGAQMIRIILGVEYDLVASDGSKITIGPIYGEANDSSDKATNKALSAAHKYALIQSFLIPTNDIDEADKDHNEIRFPKKEQTKTIVNHAPQSKQESDKQIADKKEQPKKESITHKNFIFQNPPEFKGKRFDEVEFAELSGYMDALAFKYLNQDIPANVQWFFDLYNAYAKEINAQ